MLGAYVCRQCRTRLSRRAISAHNPQWQPRATFLSLRPSEPQHAATPVQDEAEPTIQEQRPPVQRRIYNVPDIPFASPNDRPARQSRYSNLIDGNAVDDVFYTEDGQEEAYQKAKPQEVSKHEQAYVVPVRKALKLHGIGGAWETFERIYTAKDCKALTQPADPEDLEQQNLFFSHLVQSVTRSFCAGNQDVTPTAVLFRYQQLGIARTEHWVKPALTVLTHEVIQAVNIPSHRSLKYLQSLLHELISLWRLFFHCMGPHGTTPESINAAWTLPPIEELPDRYEAKDFSWRLQDYIPKYVSSPALGFCAVYFYSISDALEPALRQEAAPFLGFLERVIAGSRVDGIFRYIQKSKEFLQLPDDVQRQIIKEIDMAPRKALVAIGREGDSEDEMTNLEAFYNKRIARAIEIFQSPVELDKLWKEAEEAYPGKDKTVAIPRSIYNHFLSGYLTLFRSQRAVEVWNHMIAHGVQPDVQSWVALLEGCAKARDLNGFNAMWQRMLNTGVEPENFAWTTRINGLMSLRQVNQALAAMDEMGKRWLTAEEAIKNPQKRSKGQRFASKAPSNGVNTCAKPSIEVVNGAISAIAQMRPEFMRHEKRIEFVQKILAWSTDFQIKPDAITYNSLIQLYLRAKDTATALRILAQLEKEGLEGDIATHTMLISAAFDNHIFDSQSEQEQTEKVLKMLDGLQDNGLKLNDYVYSTVIDRLLKNYANYGAVRAVMDHMMSRKFMPSAHVYTSLITHYFQSDPPNLAEVDSIVNLLFTSPQVASDRVMYDRLVEGYASHGEIGKMMSVLTRMSKQGKLPGWGALIAVVRALAREGDYERARIVVRDVARGEGVATGGIMGDNRGKAEFARTVRRLGLAEERMGDFMGGERDMEGGRVVEQMMARQHQADSPLEQQQYQQPSLRREYAGDALDTEDDIHGFLSNEKEGQPKR